MSSSSLCIFWTLLIVFSNLPRPSRAKYSHWIGIITESEPVRALSVIRPNEGAQSINIKSYRFEF